LLSFGTHVRVIGPEVLREEVVLRATEAVGHHGKGK
jgi:hypothetical protein